MSEVMQFWGKTEETWRKRHAHMFRSDESLRWWWRDPAHRREVIEAGVVAVIAGRVMVTDPERLAELVIAIGQRDAMALYENTATQAAEAAA